MSLPGLGAGYMDQFMAKAQEMRARAEQKGAELRAKIPIPIAKQTRRKGPRITLQTIKTRQLRNVIKSKFSSFKGLRGMRGGIVGTRRGLRSGVPMFPLKGLRGLQGVPRSLNVPLGPRQAPKVVDDREPRTVSNNISVEM